MTPEQVTLERIAKAAQKAAQLFPADPIAREVLHAFAAELHNTALAALNGEEEVWEARELHEDGWSVWRKQRCKLTFIASMPDEATARRIAYDHNRLPALERAAREVLKTFGAGPYADVGGAIYALRAALTDKPEAQHEAARERRSGE